MDLHGKPENGLSLHFNGHFFQSEPGLACFIEAKDDGSGGDNWSRKTCKAPVKMSLPTNQHQTFYKLDALPVAQPTVSKHWREMKPEKCWRWKTAGSWASQLVIKNSILRWSGHAEHKLTNAGSNAVWRWRPMELCGGDVTGKPGGIVSRMTWKF